MTTVGIIVPCYNELDIIPQSAAALEAQLMALMGAGKASLDSFVCFVDDGSVDGTWEAIRDVSEKCRHFRAIRLSRNFGHQNALIAGMFTQKSSADCLITLDADLQDDISVIEKMLDLHSAGVKIVYGVRENRQTDTWFKRFTAESFYRLMRLMGVKTVFNHADYRLLDSKVVTELERFQEVSLFLRGIVPLVGFQSMEVSYSRKERTAGKTKYPIRKMLSFAWTGITSFSAAPLRGIFVAGMLMFALSIGLAAWIVIALLLGRTVQGWASTLLLNVSFLGINMLCLGIIGDYVGRIYEEVKARPRFIIEEVLKNGK